MEAQGRRERTQWTGGGRQERVTGGMEGHSARGVDEQAERMGAEGRRTARFGLLGGISLGRGGWAVKTWSGLQLHAPPGGSVRGGSIYAPTRDPPVRPPRAGQSWQSPEKTRCSPVTYWLRSVATSASAVASRLCWTSYVAVLLARLRRGRSLQESISASRELAGSSGAAGASITGAKVAVIAVLAVVDDVIAAVGRFAVQSALVRQGAAVIGAVVAFFACGYVAISVATAR